MLHLVSARADSRPLIGLLALGSLFAAGLFSPAFAEATPGTVSLNAPRAGLTEDMLRSALQRVDFGALAFASRAPVASGAFEKASSPSLFQDRLASGDLSKPFRLAASVNARDLDCMAQAVYFEARGEPALGQAAVAQVVMNRVRHPAFPKSVCGVVFQRAGHSCQFSWACHRPRDTGSTGQWAQARAVAARALAGEVVASIGFATHFNGARAGGFGSGLQRVAQIGAHAFYRFNGSKGAPSMFASQIRVAQAQPDQVAPKAVYASLAPLPSRADTQKLIASASATVQHVAEAAQSAASAVVQHMQGEPAVKAAEQAAAAPVEVQAQTVAAAPVVGG